MICICSNTTAVMQAGVIFSACLAQIGTLGCKLAIEKDWIIVICGKDKTTLASKYPLKCCCLLYVVNEIKRVCCANK